MASFTLTSAVFPPGTTVAAYKKSNWHGFQTPPSGAPVGSSDDSDTMVSAGITFTGLTEDIDYYAVGDVGGTYKYVGFRTSIGVEGFVTPTLLNSWVEADTSAYGTTGYRMETDGVVRLRGSVKDGTTGNANAPIFVLPEGFRPAKEMNFPVDNAAAYGLVIVRANGSVVGWAGNTSVSLNGITFATEA